MIRIIATFFIILVNASTSWGNVIKAYNGDVEFDHKMHRDMFKCASCHEGAPVHLTLDKQKAHKLCIGCHKTSGAGPAAHCSECHKR